MALETTGENDFSCAAVVIPDCCSPDNDVNIYEGDIDLSPDDNVDLRNSGDVDAAQNIRRKRNAARDRKRLWVTRLVPYEYDSQLPGERATPLLVVFPWIFKNPFALSIISVNSKPTVVDVGSQPGTL